MVANLPDPGVLPGEMANRNHSITWITETIIWNAVSDSMGLLRIRGCCQDNDSDVTVAGGKCMSIDIDKTEFVALSVRKRPRQRPSGKERRCHYQEKKLQYAQAHT